MASIKMVGNEIRDGAGKKIGLISGSEIRDGSGRKMGAVQGQEIRDSAGRKIGIVRGSEIRDSAERKLATLDQARKTIDGGLGGVTLAAVWMMFVR